MAEEGLFNRYAAALIDCAKERDTIDRIEHEIDTFNRIMNQWEKFAQILYHPQIAKDVKKDLIRGVVEAKGFCAQTRRFLELLVDKGRMRHLDEILTRYQSLADAIEERLRVLVVSSRALSKEEGGRLRDKLSKLTSKRVELAESIDPTLLGGLRVHFEGRVYDATVRGKLEVLERKLKFQGLTSMG